MQLASKNKHAQACLFCKMAILCYILDSYRGKIKSGMSFK